jgi:tryptophanyl-tRNA synthetase
MRELRHAVGLRALSSGNTAAAAKEAKTAVPSFKQYREKDGLFYFKLVDAKGQILLQSLGFASPKEAGQTISRLQTEGPDALASLRPVLEPALETEDSLNDILRLLKASHETSHK